MANAKVIYNTLVSKLNLPESAEEISAVAFAALQHLGVSRTDILAERDVKMDGSSLESLIQRLNNHEPLQYIFHEAWFYGRKFFADNRVLIPRPETELLIDIARKNYKQLETFSVLDIGTGSGCIAVTLALEFPQAQITATDVSAAALEVARKNADALGVSIHFIENDILRGFTSPSMFDWIVSNPPYIADSEKETMLPNVLQYEPHLALFAHEQDALIFYRSIFKTAAGILHSAGAIAVEINEKLSEAVIAIGRENGFADCSIHRDLYGKPRVVTAKFK